MPQYNGNIDNIIEQIVCTALIGDKEYQDTKDKSQRRLKYDQQTEAVNDTINGICKKIEANLPEGFNLPDNIYFDVANQLLIQVAHNPTIITNDLKLDEQAIMKDLEIPIRDYEMSEDALLGPSVLAESLYESGSELELDIFKRAHSEDATQHDKDMAIVALPIIDISEFYTRAEVKKEEISSFKMAEIAKCIETLLEENTPQSNRKAQELMEQYGITMENINSNKYGNKDVVVLDNTLNEEDAAISRRIQKFSEELETFFSVYGNRDASQRQVMFSDIIEEYEKSPEKIDIAMDSLARIAMLQPDKMNLPEFTELAKKLVRDLESMECYHDIDKYSAANMVILVNAMNQNNPNLARQILDGFNERAKKESFTVLELEDVEKLSTKEIKKIFMSQSEDAMIPGKEGYEILYKQVKSGKFNENPSIEDEEKNKIKTPDESTKTLGENNQPRYLVENKENDIPEKIMNILNGIYKIKGIEGVMKCMLLRCFDEKLTRAQKQQWLCGFSRFFDEEKNKEITDKLTSDDYDCITSAIKDITESRGEKLAKDVTTFKFVQIATSAMKNRKNILSAEKVPTEQIVKHYGNDRKLDGVNNEDIEDNDSKDSKTNYDER